MLLMRNSMDRGYFVIARSVWDHELLQDDKPFSRREAWLSMISEAAWKQQRRSYGTYHVDLRRGQLAASERFLAKKWRWSRSTVRRFLKALERADMLELAVLPVTGAGCEPSTTLITISNYDKHQLGGSERKRAGPTSKHFDRNHEPPSEPTSDAAIDCDDDENKRDVSIGGPTSEPTPGPTPVPKINKEESKTGRRERGAGAPLAPEADQESRAKTALPSSVNSSPSAEPGPKSSRRPRWQKPASKEVPLPDDWKPDFDWAVKLGIGLEEASRESEKFRNYAQMKGRVMVNWDAAWRQWCLRAIDRRRRCRDRQGGDGMSGRRFRDKGARTERAIVKALQAQGFMATKFSGMYKPGADISMPFLGSDRAVEVTQAQTTAVLTYRKQRKPALGPVGDSLDDWGTS
jgi:hypothetical protein